MAQELAQAFLLESSPRLAEVSGRVASEVVALLKESDEWAAIQFAEFAKYYKICGRPMSL